MNAHDFDLLRHVKLERAEAQRDILEQAAKEIEAKGGGIVYRKVYKAVAAFLRSMKARL